QRATPEARAAYAESFREAWLEGEGLPAGLTPEAFEAVSADMDRALAADETARGKQAAAVEKTIGKVTRLLEGGYRVPPEERAVLKAQVQNLGDPAVAGAFGQFETMANWQARASLRTPEEVAAEIAGFERQVEAQGATPADVDMLELMRGLHSRMTAGLEADPLGWAERTKGFAIDALDFSSPQSLSASLSARQADAHAVARSYGRRPKFFRPGEAAALNRSIAENPDLLLGFATSLNQALGEDTVAALEEISEDAPVVAHAAGIAIASGSERVLETTAEALKLRAIEGYEPVTMPPASRRTATAVAVGNALLWRPDMEASAMKHAELLFEVKARNARLDPKENPPLAAGLWGEALDEALGANGERGGIGVVNGQETVLPATMTGAEVQDLIAGITEDEIAALPETFSATGVPLRAAELSRARLFAVGEGRYRVALGDPLTGDPQWVMSPAGDYWELDLAGLRGVATRARRALPGGMMGVEGFR
ncbi:MAG: hypothetical protein WD036_03875, partial [Bauldia sp.]